MSGALFAAVGGCTLALLVDDPAAILEIFARPFRWPTQAATTGDRRSARVGVSV